MKILAIGAHPDDIELGCSGTVALCNLKGYTTYFLVLSLGEKGGDPKIRKQEAIKSSKVLGIKKLFFGNLQDTKIGNNITTISMIEKIINKVRPDIVLTHSSKETHQDHRNTALSTFSAARNVSTILSYESPSNLQFFSPQLFICINRTIDLKLKALKVFTSQANKDYLEIDAVLGLAKFRGYAAKAKFAEAYEVVRIIISDESGLKLIV
ncbi:MAG: PIG-L family deacetylase [Nanoarchaeota archaeon]|nr:PIG-L family deacetylase [Nanoarchaeota archaeon]MCG2718657.1 PIG-L family deacetylase [Nanoarchaeota archaeon]